MLRGDIIKPNPGDACEICDRTAKVRMVVESDSFGSETHPLCDIHAADVELQIQEERAKPSPCDWCKTTKTGCQERRDWEEGSHGPVYLVCPECWTKHCRSAQEALAEYEDDEYEDDDWDFQDVLDEDDRIKQREI